MTSITDICNRSLLAAGTRSNISSLNESSTESDACSLLFQSTFEQLARTAQWNCLRNQATLTLLQAAAGTPENINGTTLPLPPSPWLYAYAKPTDCLDVRYLVPTYSQAGYGAIPFTTASYTATPYVPLSGKIPFAVAYGTDSLGNPLSIILTNLTQAQAVYTVNQPIPDLWDSLFQQGMVASLSAFLIPALSLNMGLMDRQIKLAEQAIAAARIADGDEGYITQNREAEWIVAGSHGRYNNLTYSVQGSAYGNMAWPI